MSFLPVGHTHEDIDQLFSCISRKLKHSNAYTIPGMVGVKYACMCTVLITLSFEECDLKLLHTTT